MFDLTPATLVAGILVLSLQAYVLSAGADFGGGVWDLLARGPRRAAQRDLIASAIAPIWEANHVWLILVVVLTFTCFPPAFARLGVVLHIPLTLMLIGIVLRGSAFTFRSYDDQRDDVQRRWSRIFAGASIVTPVLLGMTIGAVASGRVVPPTGSERFADVYVWSWLTPFTLAIGAFALTLFAFLAAVYLTVEARDEGLREDFRLRALISGVAVFVVAAVALALSGVHAPLIRRALLAAPWTLPLHLITAASAITALVALARRHFRVARIAAALQASCILWGWALGQFPYVIPPDLTIDTAAAPAITLKLVLGALVVGAAILLPSLYYLFRVFKSPAAEP